MTHDSIKHVKNTSFEARGEIIKPFSAASGGDALSRILTLHVARLATVFLVTCLWVVFTLSTGHLTVAFVVLLSVAIGCTHFFTLKLESPQSSNREFYSYCSFQETSGCKYLVSQKQSDYHFHAVPSKGGKAGKPVLGPPCFATFAAFRWLPYGNCHKKSVSIDCRQDRPDLIVLKHILSQKVILPGADLRQLLAATERNMAIGIQTATYAESIS